MTKKFFVIPFIFLILSLCVNATYYVTVTNSTLHTTLYTGDTLTTLGFNNSLGLSNVWASTYEFHRLKINAVDKYYLNDSALIYALTGSRVFNPTNIYRAINFVSSDDGQISCYTTNLNTGTPYLNNAVYCSNTAGSSYSLIMSITGNGFVVGGIAISPDGNNIRIMGGNNDFTNIIVNRTTLLPTYINNASSFSSKLLTGMDNTNTDIYYYADFYNSGGGTRSLYKVSDAGAIVLKQVAGLVFYYQKIRTSSDGKHLIFYEVGANKTYYSSNYGNTTQTINSVLSYDYDKYTNTIIYITQGKDVMSLDIDSNITTNHSIRFSAIDSLTDFYYASDDQFNTTYYTPKCLNDYSICNQPYITSYYNGLPQYACYYVNTQYCNAGCINDLCYNNVANACDVFLSRICTSSSQYAVCSDSDGDGGLDYGEIHNCNTGQYCTQSFNYADCTNNTQSGVHTLYSLNVLPYAINSNSTIYNIDAVNKVVTVDTVNTIHTQKFYTTGALYLSRNCDYKEQDVYSSTPGTINTNTVLGTALGTSNELKISLSPFVNDNGNVTILSQGDTIISFISYSRNASNKQLCLYYANSSIMYCDTGTSATDDLSSIDLTYSFSMSNNFYTLKTLFNRAIPNTISTYPISFGGTDIYRVIVESTNTTVNSVKSYFVTPYTSFIPNTDVNSGQCIYTTKGTFKVRTYGNINGAPDYSSYYDYSVYIQNTGLTTSQLENIDNLNSSGFSTGAKWLIYFGLLILILVGFTLLGNSVGSHHIGMGVAVVTGIMWTIICSIPDIPLVGGLIPSWFAVFIVILTILISVLLGFKTVNSDSGGV